MLARPIFHVTLLWAILAIGSLSAQQTTGVIRGTVTDPAGAVIAGVTLSATNDQTRTTQATKSAANGTYVFPLLPPGAYTVSAENPEFSKAIRSNIVVRITETEVVDFALQLGSITITVDETISRLQTKTSAEGRVIEHRTITGLPLATRNFTQLLGLTGRRHRPAQRRAGGLRHSESQRERFAAGQQQLPAGRKCKQQSYE
jgi:hypothetical protein